MRRWSIISLRATACAVLMLALVPSAAQTKTRTWVRCADERHFLMRLDPQRAEIIIGNHQLHLRRKSSSLGRYYRSASATLIVDGDFVAFVSDNDVGWRDCRIDRPRQPSKD